MHVLMSGSLKTKGNILAKEEIGARDLTYEIKKQIEVFMGLYNLEGSKDTLDELEKIKLDQLFLRHLIVTLRLSKANQKIEKQEAEVSESN